MIAVRAFDPARRCSTEVSGPSLAPQLNRFAADLDWLERKGFSVERFRVSQRPAALAGAAAVKQAPETQGEASPSRK